MGFGERKSYITASDFIKDRFGSMEGILITQILPAVFFGLYIKSLRKEALIAGLLVGIFSGIFMLEYTNHFGAIMSSLFNIPIFGSLYITVVALSFNLAISFGGSTIMNKKERRMKLALK